MDRYDLYELCVQGVEALVPFLVAVHGGQPQRLAEDFCGTAALSRHWCMTVHGGTAVGCDLDPEPLARARRDAPAGLTLIERDVLGDVLSPESSLSEGAPADARADLVFVGNFSIGEIHDRADLIAYLRRARARLASGGVFVCDLYGGEGSLRIGHVHRDHRAPDGSRIRYTWEQRTVDPTCGMVTNALHFRIDRGGIITGEWHDAFVYRWRLWTLPELRDAMREAGLIRTAIYAKLDQRRDGQPVPVTDPDQLDEQFIVLLAAWPG